MKVVNGIIDQAQWLPSPNFGERPQTDISLLVVHNISLPPGQYGGGYVQQFFRNGLSPDEHPYFAEIANLQVSSHLFIERSGKLVQFVNLNDRAWHAGISAFEGRENCNDYSIGIELEGCDHEAYTEAQYRVLADVTQALMLAYPDITPERIVGHEHIAPGRKTDPGPAFNWSAFKKDIA
ncbi:1,6-anhydro-N-acetylmuramyl-L-alanine amidase AmpD [Bacterioplanoides sp. SCSIO 12839]|uniref:1,6-anhydro-N-acetylmuramyl-L-alanine amidase AmpD n=1 Tax=Bacterioplanoides sp. SCSIO 12839 TaxID=2829569 RepID=UPI0021021F81|nr:1,6-anhydro-N-acetylmuramyl-L-alanine amidase AmpD [Bacterioplanoides sp. SCSIO 12839]UTW47744.1 1,6-anhydro-N-acetylmuramyl-L-alanine amidase AmpD [Bacterioplanoides sp. SCSIO 12839]